MKRFATLSDALLGGLIGASVFWMGAFISLSLWLLPLLIFFIAVVATLFYNPQDFGDIAKSSWEGRTGVWMKILTSLDWFFSETKIGRGLAVLIGAVMFCIFTSIDFIAWVLRKCGIPHLANYWFPKDGVRPFRNW